MLFFSLHKNIRKIIVYTLLQCLFYFLLLFLFYLLGGFDVVSNTARGSIYEKKHVFEYQYWYNFVHVFFQESSEKLLWRFLFQTQKLFLTIWPVNTSYLPYRKTFYRFKMYSCYTMVTKEGFKLFQKFTKGFFSWQILIETNSFLLMIQ